MDLLALVHSAGSQMQQAKQAHVIGCNNVGTNLRLDSFGCPMRLWCCRSLVPGREYRFLSNARPGASQGLDAGRSHLRRFCALARNILPRGHEAESKCLALPLG